MPRHTARIKIHYGGSIPFFLYLGGYGHPNEVKHNVQLSLRGAARFVKGDPESLVINLIYELRRRDVPLTLTPRESRYNWHYLIDLTPDVPRIHIKSNISGIVDRFGFFLWCAKGKHRTNPKPRAEKSEPVTITKKRGRGRPSALDRLPLTPLPDRFK